MIKINSTRPVTGIVLILSVFLFSCSQEKTTSAYETMDTTLTADDAIRDTSKITLSELPIKFDSTDMILFVIGQIDPKERDKYYKSGTFTHTTTDLSLGQGHKDYLNGNFINIVFQDKNGSETKLTGKRILIKNVTFLRDIFESTKSGYLLYSLSDYDSNGDKELTGSDIEALYISKSNGSSFNKLTKDFHELLDWKLLGDENRVYYRTFEDKDKDGRFGTADLLHYYFIEFERDIYSVTEYNPLQIFE